MDSNTIVNNELDTINSALSLNCCINDLGSYLPTGNPYFSLIVQNIRSVHNRSNLDDLHINLHMLNIDIDVIILTECRINPDKPLPLKKNYLSYSTANKNNQNDGVVVFINKSIVHSIKEIKLHGASCLEVTAQSTVLICIYRSPSEKNPTKFIESLDTYLNSAHFKTNTILTGDININICKDNNDKFVDTYLDMLASHSLLAGHRFDTRINSCLDHIFINLDIHRFKPVVAVLDTTITDHKMVLTYIYNNTVTKKTNLTKTIINYSDALKKLQNTNLTHLLKSQDPNILCQNLIRIIIDCIQKHTKIVKIPASKRIIKPWITQGILKCIKHRNKLQKQLKLDKENDILKITYRRYRNFCNNTIKKLKMQYEKNQLDESKGNIKTLWNCIKNITYLNKQTSNKNELLNLKSSHSESAEYVNNHFINVGKKLAQNIQTDPLSTKEYYASLPTQSNSIGILEPDVTEIELIINSLKSESAAGWDGIPTKFIKMAKYQLIPIITHLSILCFQQGIFPNSLKCSIIHPIYKSGERDDINNYRPIAILTVISKIIEKLINTRLTDFLNKYNLLSKSQYGFRKGISTEDAILDLTSCITNYLDDKQKTMCIFLDIKKAFDTVSVPTLLHKIEKLGIRGMFHKLLTSYLTDRTQRVKLDSNTVSLEEETSNFGIPQGSALGPTLFLAYINDLTSLPLKSGEIFSYADDTAILIHGKDWEEVYNLAERGLRSVTKWMNLNTLSLNSSKTNYIAFSIRDSSLPDTNLTLSLHYCNNPDAKLCTCPKIEKVDSTKYLGIMIDKNLSWYPQLNLVNNRARKLVWIFKYLRNIADKELIFNIYTSLIQSILLYCISIWGGTYRTKFISIERTQRSILKIILKKKRFYSTDKLYNEANVLTVRQLYIMICVLKIHKKLCVDPKIAKKRNQYTVVTCKNSKTSLVSKQFRAQSTKLYNKLNRKLKIYTMSYAECKKTTFKYLKSLTYQQTEDLLSHNISTIAS